MPPLLHLAMRPLNRAKSLDSPRGRLVSRQTDKQTDRLAS